MSEKKNKKKASLGCLFWIAFILLIIVLFFFNKSNISDVLEKTGAKDILSGNKKGTELNGNSAEPVVPQINTKEDLVIVQPASGTSGDGSSEPLPPQTTPVPETKKETPAPAEKPAEKPATAPVAAPATTAAKPTAKVTTPTKKTETTKTVTPAPTRTATLFFVKIDADGKVIRKETSREIAKTDSPLSETLNTLFRGTSSAEAGKGYRSLIPEGTRLLSAVVKDGVATVNVSEEFQFNQFGIEGYLGQLAQVVFTATSFSTVKSVQFLIEGQRREYLGAEGVWIGTPLSRDKF